VAARRELVRTKVVAGGHHHSARRKHSGHGVVIKGCFVDQSSIPASRAGEKVEQSKVFAARSTRMACSKDRRDIGRDPLGKIIRNRRAGEKVSCALQRIATGLRRIGLLRIRPAGVHTLSPAIFTSTIAVIIVVARAA